MLQTQWILVNTSVLTTEEARVTRYFLYLLRRMDDCITNDSKEAVVKQETPHFLLSLTPAVGTGTE